MTYIADWQTAKKQFEAATGKKKPSEKFLGVFRQGSGIEKAAKGLDEGLKKASVDAAEKALAAFQKASLDYLKTLDKADAAEKNADFSREIDNLKKALQTIESKYADEQEGIYKAEILKKYANAISAIPASVKKCDGFIADIQKFVGSKAKADLMKLVSGDSNARGYATACKLWDQIFRTNCRIFTSQIYTGEAMKDFFPFAQNYGANKDPGWWDQQLTSKGDEATGLAEHAKYLASNVGKVQTFRKHLVDFHKLMS